MDGLIFTRQTAGTAFEASLPGKNNLLLLKNIVLYRADIETGFIPARFAPGFIDLYMGPVINPEAYPG